MATRRRIGSEAPSDGPTLTSKNGSVSYRLFETTSGVVVQRSTRPGGLTRIDHFVRFDRLESLAACADLEAQHLGEPRLRGRLMRAFGPKLGRRQQVDLPVGAAALTVDYASCVLNLVQRIQEAANQAEVMDLMHLAIEAMGADAGCFVGIIPEPGSAPSVRCLFDFDVATCCEQLRQPCCLNDPWLTYARLNAEPIVIADDAPAAERMGVLASTPAFSRALVIPTPAAHGSMRFGGMALGSASEGIFEPEDAGLSCLLGRALAAEVNGWWSRTSAEVLRREARLDAVDLQLLRLQRDGADWERTVHALRTTAQEARKRSTGMVLRLGVSDLQAAVQRALAHGVL